MTRSTRRDHARLPDGFEVRLDAAVLECDEAKVLIGGSPKTMLSLAPAAWKMIDNGVLEVVGPASAAVARRLLDSGIGNPEPVSTGGFRPEDMTVVIPVKNNSTGLARLLAALDDCCVIVVDDGSAEPVSISEIFTAGAKLSSLTVLRHEISRGPAAARNTGLSQVGTELVVFLDSDVVPRAGWFEVTAAHFADPAVALVAPRIVALAPESSALARYEHCRSSLDLGRKHAAVRPGSAVSYVPSAAMVVRRRAVDECAGFDENMHVGEDVDLCWRLHEAGWRLRYDPDARVAHDHRIDFRKWFVRRLFYGTSAGPLADRHPGMVPPVSMSPRTLAAVLSAATCTKSGSVTALSILAFTVDRLRRKFHRFDRPLRVAVLLTAESFGQASKQLASALCRHYWPLTLIAGVVSRRARRLSLAIAVAEAAWDWLEHRDSVGLDPIRYVFFKRLDDIAYGTGLWCGAVQSRSMGALLPRLGT